MGEVYKYGKTARIFESKSFNLNHYRVKRFVIFSFILTCPLTSVFSQGLKFKGSDYLINERTSYDVFSDYAPVFAEKLIISFDIMFSETSNVGCILRIKNNTNNTTFNLSYNGAEENAIFKFNEEGKSSLVTGVFSFDEIENYKWHNIVIAFDMKTDSLCLTIDEKRFVSGNVLLPDTWTPSVLFGKSEHIIDVPSFSIKNLEINDDKTFFRFLLNENHGGDVRDFSGKIIGNVTEPVWLINDAYFWKFRDSFQMKTVAGSNFDAKNQEILYFNADSIVHFNVLTNNTRKSDYHNKFPMKLRLGTSFIDELNSKIYAYEVYGANGDVSISSLNFDDNKWDAVSNQELPTQLHHHVGYFDAKNNRYILFGGFGNWRYSNTFFAFDLTTNQWDTLTFAGDKITPRYFVSIGNVSDANKLYIFGGMGNESGDQTVGRIYYYDFYEVDLDSMRITKLWEIPWDNENVVPVKGLIISNDTCFYTLCYPEHFTNSYLKLYRFSMLNGDYEILGDSIPIRSEKINTNANLYYNDKFSELYTTIQEFDDSDTGSEIKIYSLAFPPISLQELKKEKHSKANLNLTFLLLTSIIIILLLLLYVFRRRIFSKIESEEITPKHDDTVVYPLNMDKPNAIYLFGDFAVFDRQQREISYMFSAKLKQAFFIIFQHSLDNGITSQNLSELLWSDKPENKIKNLRGVTLNHLRKTLGDLEGIQLIHEKGYYKIVTTGECYCDLTRCFEIISDNIIESEDNLKELIQILSKGKFLKSEDSSILDAFKESVEYKLEPVLLLEMEKSFAAQNYSITILLGEIIFNFDPVNEKAISFLIRSMLKLKMNDEAKRRYTVFSVEYKKMMGEEYPTSFVEIG